MLHGEVGTTQQFEKDLTQCINKLQYFHYYYRALASDITKFPISTIQSAKCVWYLRAQTAIIGIATQKSYFIARGKLG